MKNRETEERSSRRRRRGVLRIGLVGGVGEGLFNVLQFQIRVEFEETRFRAVRTDHARDQADGYSHAADAGFASHDSGVVRDAVERAHVLRLGYPGLGQASGAGGRPTVRWTSEPPFSSMVRRIGSIVAMEFYV